MAHAPRLEQRIAWQVGDGDLVSRGDVLQCDEAQLAEVLEAHRVGGAAVVDAGEQQKDRRRGCRQAHLEGVGIEHAQEGRGGRRVGHVDEPRVGDHDGRVKVAAFRWTDAPRRTQETRREGARARVPHERDAERERQQERHEPFLLLLSQEVAKV